MKKIETCNGKIILVDDKDFKRVSRYTWYATCQRGRKWYAIRVTYLHRFILGESKIIGKQVDHINGNGLDVRRKNLRPATRSQNMMNTPKMNMKTSSKFKGVCWNKKKGKWQSGIKTNGVNIVIGIFEDEIEAAKAYDKRAKMLFGDYAFLNFKENKK